MSLKEPHAVGLLVCRPVVGAQHQRNLREERPEGCAELFSGRSQVVDSAWST